MLFIFVLCVALFYTKKENLDKTYDNKSVKINGIVKEKRIKARYDEYKIGEFLVKDYSRKKDFTVGQELNIEGKFKNLNNMKYEDFDYGTYLKSNGYKGLIYINKYKKIGENKLYTNLGKSKNYISNTTRYLYKKNSDFINSLYLGQKEDLSTDELEMFSRTGTSHIIAISGMNTTILCVLISYIIGGINKVSKLIVVSIIMVLYCMMVGTSPSIVRAIAFTIILYSAIFIDKKRDGISTLSLIGMFLVINNPYIIYNISFQLSFLATLSIIYFYGCINNKLKVSLISLTLASNILTLPIIYYNFKGIPVISIISNMVIVPFIGLIMYLSIISLILFKINIGIAKLVAYFNKGIINVIYFLLEKLSNFKFSYIEIDKPSIYLVVIYYVTVFSYMVYKELKVMKEQANELQGYYK
ncbi:MAG: ComEC/Rec2 family competence protein [Romboutsia sp.]